MKHARKLTSLLLALVMVFALAVTVAAEEATETTGTITVANPVADKAYTAYKIFDVVYEEPTTADHYSYTIDSGSEWFTTVQSYTGLKLIQVKDTTTYIVEKLGSFSAPSFAETLKAAAADKTGDTLTKAEGASTITFSGLKLGYYFVTSTNGALCNLTTTDPTVIIHDKNEMPFEKTAPEKSVEVGQTVHYTIKGKVPDYTGFDEYTYAITDTMSEGLTFKKDVTVTVSGADVTTACTPTYDVEKNANKFTVSIPVKNYPIGAEILVTYSAVVNEKAVATVSTNEAKLTYSNDPTDKESKDTKPAEKHKVYSAKITIDKYWTDKGQEKPLENVGFKLYKKEPVVAGGAETIQYYVKNETTKAVTWDTDIKNATEVKTSATGEANFTGLANGTYYLVESTTPAGFNPLTEVKTITVNGDDTGANLTVTERVENKTGAVLPSTGGMGTTVFYVLGAVLVVGAGVLLVTKKRMSQGEV